MSHSLLVNLGTDLMESPEVFGMCNLVPVLHPPSMNISEMSCHISIPSLIVPLQSQECLLAISSLSVKDSVVSNSLILNLHVPFLPLEVVSNTGLQPTFSPA